MVRDSDFDMFAGEYYGRICYYENTGSAASPVFTARTGAANPFNGVDLGDWTSPDFVDIDGDSDFDAFICENGGNINYFKNTGTVASPTFTETTGAGNPFNGVSVGLASPGFVDMDNDSVPDVFFGRLTGIIEYYANEGTLPVELSQFMIE